MTEDTVHCSHFFFSGSFTPISQLREYVINGCEFSTDVNCLISMVFFWFCFFANKAGIKKKNQYMFVDVK